MRTRMKSPTPRVVVPHLADTDAKLEALQRRVDVLERRMSRLEKQDAERPKPKGDAYE